MSKQALLEQAKICLEQGEYETAIAVLESCIGENPEELTYYWYFGLAYLLNGQEFDAQSVWMSLFLDKITIEEVENLTMDLVLFMEKRVKDYLRQEEFANAKVIYDALLSIKDDYKNLDLLNDLITALLKLATQLSYDKHYETAINVYFEILSLAPNNSLTWHSLALCHYYLEQYQEAESAIRQAIEVDKSFPHNYQVLGLILEKQEKNDEAIKAYQEELYQNPQFIDAYVNMGDLFLRNSQPDKAIEMYSKALEKSATNPIVLAKIADAYQVIGDDMQAIFHRGFSSYYNGHNGSFDEALNDLENFYEKSPDSKQLNFQFYMTIAQCYFMCNKSRSAMAILNNALNLFPDFQTTIKRLNQVILPIEYSNQDEITYYRQRFEQLLKKLIKETKLDTEEEKEDALKSISFKTNFYLAYQGRNDLEIQKLYGTYVHNIFNKIYPQWCLNREHLLPLNNRKIRIGYISTRLNGLGEFYIGWVKHSNQQDFDIFVYDLQTKDETELSPLKKEFQKYSNHFKSILPNANWNQVRQEIVDDKLDILIFPELGLDPVLNRFAFIRLAPIQCTTWAHPITSGSPTIDYFLSSDLMEPLNGDEHYSEQLIRLPNLAFSFASIECPKSTKNRSDFQFKEDAIVYLCCQSLFKYLPQHDYIFPAIAQASTSFQFIFLESNFSPKITQCMKKRLEQAFRDFNLDFQDYCNFIPRQSEENFFILQTLADVFLDGISWSGGDTTQKALTCGLPVVTCPGEFMRMRHSYAMLQRIGVTETIANSEEEYIEIAIRLGLDSQWRQSIREKILANKDCLFEDQECIVALEAFFQMVVHQRS